MFDYKQRPFASHVTEGDYDLATGRKPRASVPEVSHADIAEMSQKLDGLIKGHECGPCEVCKPPAAYQVRVIHLAGEPCHICGLEAEHVHVGRII